MSHPSQPASPPRPPRRRRAGGSTSRAPSGLPVLVLVLLGASGLFNAAVAVYAGAGADLLVTAACGACAVVLLSLTWGLSTRPRWL